VTKGQEQGSNYLQATLHTHCYCYKTQSRLCYVTLCYVMPVYLWYTQYNKFYQAPQINQNWFLPKLWRCWRMTLFFFLKN